MLLGVEEPMTVDAGLGVKVFYRQNGISISTVIHSESLSKIGIDGQLHLDLSALTLI